MGLFWRFSGGAALACCLEAAFLGLFGGAFALGAAFRAPFRPATLAMLYLLSAKVCFLGNPISYHPVGLLPWLSHPASESIGGNIEIETVTRILIFA